MPHPLEHQIGAVRRRAGRLVWAFGASRLATTFAAILLSAGLADYLVRYQDRGVRVILSLAALAAAGWAVYRFSQVLRGARFRDLDVALKIERRFPQLQDRLASTVQFLHEREDDPLAGSAALRRALIGQTAGEIDGLDLAQALEPAPARRAVAVAAAIGVLALAVVALNPASSRTAMVRLFNPFSQAAWPQQHHLTVKNPLRRLAAGQAFEAVVVDAAGAALPEEVWLQLRYRGEGDTSSEVVEPMQFVNGEMIARKENVSQPFAYRAVGGDDASMAWIELEVVEPPQIEELAVTLHYPDYTGWPAESGDRHIHALTGTRVEMRGRATKPLSSGSLEIVDGPSIKAAVGADGYSFSLPAPGGEPFVVDKSGEYWIKLADRDGFAGGEQLRYEIRADEDLAPAVTLDEPAANIFVTPQAVVPLKISVKDDLAIKQIAFYYSRSDKSDVGEESFSLYAGPPKVERRAARQPAGDLTGGESRALEHRWELAPLELKPGVQLIVYAAASDYRPLVGQSQPRRLTVITTNELAERLAERQNFVLGELARMLKLEREAREQVSGLEIQLRQLGELAKQDLDHLQGAELTQRQVDRGLVSPGEGVAAQIAGLLAELTNNKVDSPDVERHMRRLLDELGRLGEQELPVISRELTTALKSSQADAGDQQAAGRALAAAGRHQDEVIRSLEQMLGELSEWDNYRRFHREIGQLRHDQETINEQTAELGRQTLAKDFKDLTAQQQADLKKLAARQLELSRQFDKIEQRMQRIGAELDGRDPLAAGAIADALAEARQRAVGSQMREAGRQLGENQLGQAQNKQAQIAENLQEVLDILANRRQRELTRLVKKLRESERKLAELREAQQGLRKKWQEAEKLADEAQRKRELERLSRQQRELQQQAERLGRQLERLQAERASRSMARGGAKMGRAGQQGQQGAAQAAAEQAEAAQQDLDDAQQQLAEARRQAEQDLADEQLARLEDALKSIEQRQAQTLTETRRYDEIRESQGDLTRAQWISVGDLVRQQQSLETEIRELAEKLSAKAFQFSLAGVAREMAAAAAQLGRRQLGVPAQDAMHHALTRLAQLMSALKPDADEQPAAQEEPEAPGGENGSAGQPGDALRMVAELKLIGLMQTEINERTKALEEARRKTGELTPEERQTYAELSEEQGKLADLTLDLVEPEQANPEDDPENLPKLKLEEE